MTQNSRLRDEQNCPIRKYTCDENFFLSLSYVQTDATTANIVGSCCCGRYWMQHCCATLPWSRNKSNVGSCWLKSFIGFKLRATTVNNTQQGMQTDATCHTQQCWELLHGNVASVCAHRQEIWSINLALQTLSIELAPNNNVGQFS